MQMTSPTRAHQPSAGERRRRANSARIPKGSSARFLDGIQWKILEYFLLIFEDLFLFFCYLWQVLEGFLVRIASRPNIFCYISSCFRGIPCCLCFPSSEPRHQSRFFDLAIPISICSHRSTHPNSWLIVVGIGGNGYMGNGLACMPKKDLRGGIGSRSRRGSYSRSQRKTAASEEELLHHQALAMAIHQHQLSQRFDGSMSRRIGSTSSRRRDLPDSVTNGKLPPAFLENLETRKIILVHGEGFGAWCWYKIMSLLEESGLLPVALDLTGSGIDQTDINSITSLEDYARPLITCLQSLPDDEKVILVGHSCGGAIVSYALESYPRKVSKAVYVCATMVLNGQKPFDVFSKELASADLFLQESQFLVYGNGRDKPPTSIMFDKQQIRALYFNQSPPKDVALATVSMRPIPLAPIMEKLSLTTENYGTVRRYFIQTLDDRILSLDVQERLVRENPPHGMYKIKGSDHCPFFSKPQTLNKILIEIVQIPLENALNDPS